LKSVRYEGDFKMPPKAQLPAEAVAVLTEWLKGGAAFPTDVAINPGARPRTTGRFKR